jgi:radical SAM superfamily enzyme YgiQ (UPF0313 family)
MIATMANRLQHWDVEVIDENNIRGRFCPKDRNKHPDHNILQTERPADVVALYGSLTSTIPRLFQVARFYRDRGVITLAGGKHVENLPEEALENGIDIVGHGEGEYIIQEILTALENSSSLSDIAGIHYREAAAGESGAEHRCCKTEVRPIIEELGALPYPDFNLVRYAKIKIYPINWSRGCNMHCEFCAVKSRSRCSSPEYMINQIAYLVETRNAGQFFEVSDHFASRTEEAIRFCGLLSEYQQRIGKRLRLNIQTRITDARNPELLQAMRSAGINMIAVGYESPIDEDLKAMNKGYLSKDMVGWTKTFRKQGFFIHGMFIFGYPRQPGAEAAIHLSLKEKIKRYRQFIQEAKIDTLQVVMPIPLPGTELRKRLAEEERIYPRDQIGWEYYDGQFPVFEPDDDISPEELQKAVGKIMRRFYSLRSIGQMIVRILFHFPIIMIPASTTLVTLKAHYLVNAFIHWKRRYFRNPLLRFGGFIIQKQWFKAFKESTFMEKLSTARLRVRNRRSRLKNKRREKHSHA